MKITIVTSPRQKGKTDLALYEMSKQTKKSVYLCHRPREIIKRFKDKINNPKFELYNFLAYGPNAPVCPMRPEVVIFDEFFFAKNYKNVWEAIIPLEPKKVFIFSSIRGEEDVKLLGDKSIEKQEDLDFIKMLKENNKVKHIKLK